MKRKLVKVTYPDNYLPKAVYGMTVTGKINNRDGSQAGSDPFGLGGDHTVPDVEVNRTLKPTPRAMATLEAEVGETVVTGLDPANSGGIPEFYTVGGKRHSQGGTPLNLPADSFIFSRDRKMAISDHDVLALFGKSAGKKGKKKYHFAELSKTYDINPYRKILADPNSDKKQKDTAEMMIQNYNLKLGQLALIQESMKGFPNGIPGLAMPYIEHAGIDPGELLGEDQAQAQAPQQEMPQMSMGKYGGEPQYAVGGSIPQYAVGGPADNYSTAADYYASQNNFRYPQQAPGTVPETAGKPTRYQDIPSKEKLKKTGKVKWDMSKEGYDESKVEEGDYVKKKDGKWHKVTGYSKTNTPYEGGFEDKRLMGEKGDNQENFGRIQQRIEGNDELKEAIYQQYLDNIAKAKPGKNLTEADLSVARGLSKEKVIDNFYKFQKQIMAVQANKGNDFDEADSWDKDQSKYANTLKGLGFSDDELMNPAQTAAFQATYIGMQNLASKGKHKKDLEDFGIIPFGKADEKGKSGTGKANISGIDGFLGNTTIGQGTYYDPKTKELSMEEADWKDNPADVEHLGYARGQDEARNWTEDNINLFASGMNLLNTRKGTPWTAMPGTKLPTPTLRTPDAQINAIHSATGLGTRMAGAFGSPQAFAANFSGIHNNAMGQVANAIAQVQDANVRTVNQFELQRAQIMNRANQKRSLLATSQHDKQEIANQAYANEIAGKKDVVRRMLVNRWTNKGKTQNLNTMNDQYYIDPQTGYKHFRDPREVKPKNAQSNDVYDLAKGYRNTSPDMSWNEALKFAKARKGIAESPTGGSGMDPREMASSYPNAANSGYYPQG
jgi:hypothetical protein